MAKKDLTLQKIVALLKKEFKPSRLYLFGSRANGNAKKESDYDFVMVLPKFRGDRMVAWERCHDLIYEQFGILVDVFTYSDSEFNKYKSEFSSIPETAASTGQELDLGAF